MSDPIQRSSSVPLPPYQTIQGSQNLVTPNSAKSLDRANTTTTETNEEQQQTNFESYLNQQSVTTLEKTLESTVYDTASDIQNNGVYQQPGVNTPV